ncbi:hypothetical protein [Aureimonas psammosilenae]|uniref:hypothetical protein n=1 Tax=Aureimonas psammosilenae TaxID=2495496 RepID=UPI0012606253|nr:hypothetical protein [Aureimonas psammosilenae]
MIDLASISDDDLVSEIARRELHKHRGVFALMSESMLDYHAMWAGIVAYSSMVDGRDGFMSAHAYELRTTIFRLVDDHPRVAVGPVNTTFRGAEDRIHEIARAA